MRYKNYIYFERVRLFRFKVILQENFQNHNQIGSQKSKRFPQIPLGHNQLIWISDRIAGTSIFFFFSRQVSDAFTDCQCPSTCLMPCPTYKTSTWCSPTVVSFSPLSPLRAMSEGSEEVPCTSVLSLVQPPVRFTRFFLVSLLLISALLCWEAAVRRTQVNTQFSLPVNIPLLVLSDAFSVYALSTSQMFICVLIIVWIPSKHFVST